MAHTHWNEKRLRQWLRQHDLSDLEIAFLCNDKQRDLHNPGYQNNPWHIALHWPIRDGAAFASAHAPNQKAAFFKALKRIRLNLQQTAAGTSNQWISDLTPIDAQDALDRLLSIALPD